MEVNLIGAAARFLGNNFDLGTLNACFAGLNSIATLWLMMVVTGRAGFSCCCSFVTLVHRAAFAVLAIVFLVDAAVSIEAEARPWESHVAINALLLIVLVLGAMLRSIERRGCEPGAAGTMQ